MGHPPPPKYNNPVWHLVFMGLRFFCVSTSMCCLRYFTPFRVSSFVTTCVSSWDLVVFTPTQAAFFRFKSSTNISLGIKRLGLIQFTAGTFSNALVIPTFNFNLLWYSERMCRWSVSYHKTVSYFVVMSSQGNTTWGLTLFNHTNLTQTSRKPHTNRLFEA